jgi:hypothetical protein
VPGTSSSVTCDSIPGNVGATDVPVYELQLMCLGYQPYHTSSTAFINALGQLVVAPRLLEYIVAMHAVRHRGDACSKASGRCMQ